MHSQTFRLLDLFQYFRDIQSETRISRKILKIEISKRLNYSNESFEKDDNRNFGFVRLLNYLFIARLIDNLTGCKFEFAHRYQMRFGCGADVLVSVGVPGDPTVQGVDQRFDVTTEIAVIFADHGRTDTPLKLLTMLDIDVFHFVYKWLHFVVVRNFDAPGILLIKATVQWLSIMLSKLIE